jgi:hypothetical protein
MLVRMEQKKESRAETGTRKSELSGVRKHFMSIAFERGKTSTMGHSRGGKRQEQVGESEGVKLTTTTLFVITSQVALIKKQLRVDAEELFSVSAPRLHCLCRLPD